jgi:hypothetical protein
MNLNFVDAGRLLCLKWDPQRHLASRRSDRQRFIAGECRKALREGWGPNPDNRGISIMIETTLHKLAEHILGLDEASLASLWEKYKTRTENFEISREWEKAVIIFFIINAVRAKNQMFNEQIQQRNQPQPEPGQAPRRPRGKPDLRRVK